MRGLISHAKLLRTENSAKEYVLHCVCIHCITSAGLLTGCRCHELRNDAWLLVVLLVPVVLQHFLLEHCYCSFGCY
jgi:hypothetical protein